jgi:opacity protein-like surface antigen
MRDARRFFARSESARRAAAGALALASVWFVSPAAAEPSSLPPEVGYNHGFQESPRIAAMAGAMRAFSNSTDALFLNPANMASTRVYHVSAFAQLWPDAKRQSYGLAVVDSGSSSRLAGGAGGTWNRQEPDGVDRTAWDLRFALAYPFSDLFFLGLAGRYLSMKQDGYPRGLYGLRPSQASAGLPGEPIVTNITFDAGVTVKPIKELALSIVGANITDPGHSFLPLLFGGGAGYGTRDFTIEADVMGDFTTYDEAKIRAMGGGEYLAAHHVPLRLGYRYDQGMRNHTVTGGIGYLDTAYAVELAIQRTVSGDNPGTAIILGFRYHVDGAGQSAENYESE